MVGLILAAVGTVVSAVGGAVRKGQERTNWCGDTTKDSSDATRL